MQFPFNMETYEDMEIQIVSVLHTQMYAVSTYLVWAMSHIQKT